VLPGAAQADERQVRVIEALDARSPNLAGIYRAALNALALAGGLGGANARVSIICHCMRELMNGLPSVMSDTSIPRPSPSSDALKAKLPELLAEHPDVDLGLDQDLLPVPRAVARMFESLITTVAQEQGRNRSIAAVLVTGVPDTKHPAISQWRAAQDFFLGWTHLDRNHEGGRELPSDDILRMNMRVVEDVIEVRTALFFENLRAVEDLLDEANALDDGGES
jgi:hypothetical protein